MISKVGSEIIGLEKRASALRVARILADPAIGVYRANNLSPEERKKLREKYLLAEDADLALRNAGRGIIGGMLGSVASFYPASLLYREGNEPLRHNYQECRHGGELIRDTFKHKAFRGAGLGMGILGQLLGAKWMTDKYSKSNFLLSE